MTSLEELFITRDAAHKNILEILEVALKELRRVGATQLGAMLYFPHKILRVDLIGPAVVVTYTKKHDIVEKEVFPISLIANPTEAAAIEYRTEVWKKKDEAIKQARQQEIDDARQNLADILTKHGVDQREQSKAKTDANND